MPANVEIKARLMNRQKALRIAKQLSGEECKNCVITVQANFSGDSTGDSGADSC